MAAFALGGRARERTRRGVRIAFARSDDCTPPQVLKARFEVGGAPRRGLRNLKRWIRGRSPTTSQLSEKPHLEELAIAIADRPGVVTAAGAPMARDFMKAFAPDFESARELVWILETRGWTEKARAVQYRRTAGFGEQMVLPFAS